MDGQVKVFVLSSMCPWLVPARANARLGIVSVGTEANQSNAAFYKYDQALLGIIGINQNAFRAAIDNGQSALGVWTWLPYAAGIAVLVLVGAALYPRLREYR